MIFNGLEFRKTHDAFPEKYYVYRGDKRLGRVIVQYGQIKCNMDGHTVYTYQMKNKRGCFICDSHRAKYLGKIANVIRENSKED